MIASASTIAPIGSRSRDPIGYQGSPWNVYEFAASSPQIYLHPQGQGIFGIIKNCVKKAGKWFCDKVDPGEHIDDVGNPYKPPKITLSEKEIKKKIGEKFDMEDWKGKDFEGNWVFEKDGKLIKISPVDGSESISDATKGCDGPWCSSPWLLPLDLLLPLTPGDIQDGLEMWPHGLPGAVFPEKTIPFF